MKKTLLATVVLVGALTTGAVAYNQNCKNGGENCQKGTQQGMMQGQGKNQKGMQQNEQIKKKGWHGYKMRQKGIKHNDNSMQNSYGTQMFSKLNLTDDQKYKLSILKDEMKLEMKKLRGPKKQNKMMKFVNDSGFDKKAFTKEAESKSTKRIALRANHMEKVFKVLTKEQIAELKKNLKK